MGGTCRNSATVRNLPQKTNPVFVEMLRQTTGIGVYKYGDFLQLVQESDQSVVYIVGIVFLLSGLSD